MCARLSLTPRMGQISDFKVSLHQAEAAVHNYVVASDHKKLPKAFLHEIAFSTDVGLSEGTLLGRQMRVGPKGQLDISWTTLDYMLKKNLVKGNDKLFQSTLSNATLDFIQYSTNIF